MKINDGYILFENDDELFLEILNFYLPADKIQEVMGRAVEYKRDILRLRKEKASSCDI